MKLMRRTTQVIMILFVVLAVAYLFYLGSMHLKKDITRLEYQNNELERVSIY